MSTPTNTSSTDDNKDSYGTFHDDVINNYEYHAYSDKNRTCLCFSLYVLRFVSVKKDGGKPVLNSITYNDNDKIFSPSAVKNDVERTLIQLESTLEMINLVIYLYSSISGLTLGIIGLALPTTDTNKLIIGIITAVNGFIISLLNYLYDYHKKYEVTARDVESKLYSHFPMLGNPPDNRKI